ADQVRQFDIGGPDCGIVVHRSFAPTNGAYHTSIARFQRHRCHAQRNSTSLRSLWLTATARPASQCGQVRRMLLGQPGKWPSQPFMPGKPFMNEPTSWLSLVLRTECYGTRKNHAIMAPARGSAVTRPWMCS